MNTPNVSLEEVQHALFAAYDVRSSLSPHQLDEYAVDSEDTIGDKIEEVILFLEALEEELTPATDETRSNGPRA